MGFRNFGKTQLGKYSAKFNWEGAVKRSLKGLLNALTHAFGHKMYSRVYESESVNTFVKTQTVIEKLKQH